MGSSTMSERFFSRIALRPQAPDSASFWRAFRDPYSIHHSVWELFTDGPDRKRDFIYHVKDDRKPPVIYAVSCRMPAGDHLLWSVDAKEYRPRLEQGLRLAFSLRANPIVTREGRRHDVVMDAKKICRAQDEPREAEAFGDEIVQGSCLNWLEKRAESSGFRTLAARADGYRQHSFLKRGQQHPVKFSTVDFKGILEVIEPETFRTTLFDGLGHAKGFGCGMLMVKRVG